MVGSHLFREYHSTLYKLKLTGIEYASQTSTRTNCLTTVQWREFFSKRPIEYVSFNPYKIILITTALINIPKPHRLSPVRSLFSPGTTNPNKYSTTMDSGPNGDSFLAPRMLPDPDEGGDYRWPSACSPPLYCLISRKLLTIPVTHPIRILTSTTHWSSTSCPTPTGPKPLFAIGTSDGLQILTGQGSHWSLTKAPFPDDRGHRRPQVNAVEWLSGDVIAAGCKDSSVFLHDTRSGGSAVRLWHPGAVAVGGIKRVDEWRVVVGGYNSVYSLSYLI